MNTTNLLGIGVVVVLLLILAYFRKSKVKEDDHGVVPISDIAEIQALRKKQSSADENKLSQASFTDHVVQENLKPPVQAQEKSASVSHEENSKVLKKDVEMLKHQIAQKDKQIQQLHEENERLSKAMEREVALNAAVPPSSQISERDYKQMMAQNEELKKDNQDMKQSMRKLENELEVAKVMQEITPTQEEMQRMQELEKEVALLKSENARLNEQRNTIGSREMENMTLKKLNEETTLKLKELTSDFDHLKTESKKCQAELNSQLESEREQKQQLLDDIRKMQDSVNSSEEKLSRLKKDNLEQIEDAKQKISELEDELNHIKSSKNIFENDRLLDTAKNELKQAGDNNQSLMAEKKELEEALEKLKQHNAYLSEKEKLLQYELTKARAKALGLEQVCLDYKIKIEQISNAV